MLSNEIRKRVERWIAAQVRQEREFKINRPLLGGISSAVYEVTFGAEIYVLRLYTDKEWNKREPDLAWHEANSLQVAERLQVNTPKLISLDETGEYCGYPAVLMSMVPGQVDLFPSNRNRCLTELAKTLNLIHSGNGFAKGSLSEENNFKWLYFPYHDIKTLTVPNWSIQPELWSKAIQFARQHKPEENTTFIHRDYHPMNVLWQDNQVSGVVDWVNACLGPRGVDVGHCRLNLALLYGSKVADQFLKVYQEEAGTSFTYDSYWDLRMIFEMIPWPIKVYQGWIDVGLEGLTDELIMKRLEAYLQSVWEKV